MSNARTLNTNNLSSREILDNLMNVDSEKQPLITPVTRSFLPTYQAIENEYVTQAPTNISDDNITDKMERGELHNPQIDQSTALIKQIETLQAHIPKMRAIYAELNRYNLNRKESGGAPLTCSLPLIICSLTTLALLSWFIQLTTTINVPKIAVKDVDAGDYNNPLAIFNNQIFFGNNVTFGCQDAWLVQDANYLCGHRNKVFANLTRCLALGNQDFCESVAKICRSCLDCEISPTIVGIGFMYAIIGLVMLVALYTLLHSLVLATCASPDDCDNLNYGSLTPEEQENVKTSLNLNEIHPFTTCNSLLLMLESRIISECEINNRAINSLIKLDDSQHLDINLKYNANNAMIDQPNQDKANTKDITTYRGFMLFDHSDMSEHNFERRSKDSCAEAIGRFILNNCHRSPS